MQEDTALLKKRFNELSNQAFGRGCWVFSDFLSLAEQSVLHGMKLQSPFTLSGGYPAAERVVACFGSEELCGYIEEPPIVCVKIAPVNARFADALSHRDFLGSLTALGIDRRVLGDILVRDSVGWLFCRDSIAGYIIEQLSQVRHTTVRCEPAQAPGFSAEPPELSEAVIASERLDAVIAGVYDLSRAEGKAAVEGGKVYIDGWLTENPSAQIKPGAIVSVRGTGRFLYEGIKTETRRGRLRVIVRIYK